MVCKKCGYSDIREVNVYGSFLCSICALFYPQVVVEFQDYISEKVDWRTLEPYRRFSHNLSDKKVKGMEKAASRGRIVTRKAYGYDIVDGKLVKSQNSSIVFSLFRKFLNGNYSLNFLARDFGFSVNGIKKLLKNRVYLGEIKFGGNYYKGEHEPIIPQDLFYAVQRKLEELSRKKKNL